MSSWTFCLHVLVYITTLIQNIIYSALWVYLAFFALQRNARVADVKQPIQSGFSDRTIGGLWKICAHRNVLILLALILPCQWLMTFAPYIQFFAFFVESRS
jgi:hypothetical protein